MKPILLSSSGPEPEYGRTRKGKLRRSLPPSTRAFYMGHSGSRRPPYFIKITKITNGHFCKSHQRPVRKRKTDVGLGVEKEATRVLFYIFTNRNCYICCASSTTLQSKARVPLELLALRGCTLGRKLSRSFALEVACARYCFDSLTNVSMTPSTLGEILDISVQVRQARIYHG